MGFGEGDRSEAVVAAVCVCLAVGTIMVSVRLYTRVFLVRQVGLDDYLAAVTLVLIYGVGVGLALNTQNGFGRHVVDLTDSDIFLYKRSLYATLVLYTTALLAVKTTLLIQYYRLFSVRSHTRTLYISALVLVVLWSLSQVFLAALACLPVSAFWDDSVRGEAGGAKCLPPMPLLYSNAAGNIATEVAVLTLPLPVLSALNLPRSQRTMLIGIFSLGFLTVIISVIRIRHLNSLSDITYETVLPALLSLAELTTALTCACLLTLRPIITRAAPSHHHHASKFTLHPNKHGSYHRHSGTSTTVARSSYSSQQQQQQPMQQTTQPRRGSAAVRYLASMQSREGLYDDKYMLTASSYELEHYPTESPGSVQGTTEPPPVAPAPVAFVPTDNSQRYHHHHRLSRDSNALLRRSNTTKTTAGAKSGLLGRGRWFSLSARRERKAGGPEKREWMSDAEGTAGVTTEIDNRGQVVKPSGRPTPKWEIGVQTTVYQTYQPAYLATTAVRC